MRNRSLAFLVPAVLLVALVPAGPASARLGPSWVTGPDYSPPLGTTGAEWRDVSASGPGDIWAAGVLRNPADNPLTARWNGKGWQAAAIPAAPAGRRYNLTAVDAVAVGDTWAAGSAVASGTRDAAAFHHNGTAWTAVSLPILPVGVASELSDVEMTAGDGWAVGYQAPTTKPQRALVLRRQGAVWSRVAVPDGDASSSELSAVFVRASDDAWAVGSQVRLDGRRVGLVVHWDGAVWAEYPVPVLGDTEEETLLASVSVTPGGDAWAAGRICHDISELEFCRPLALHLVDGAWVVVPTDGEETELTEIVAFAPDDVWAIGYTGVTALTETDSAEHWDGVKFTPDASGPPNPDGPIANGEPVSALEAATAVPGTGAIWAVGWARDPVRGGTHLVHRP